MNDSVANEAPPATTDDEGVFTEVDGVVVPAVSPGAGCPFVDVR